MSSEQSVTVKDLQIVLFNILKDFDSICKENDIQYSLAAGTLLGAVRHKGFIPWDDDIDLFLSRDNYDKLLKLDNSVFQNRGYTLQKAFSKSWASTYSKLCKNNTTYIENYQYKNKDQHHGIFIDLMPIDHLSDKHIMQLTQWYCYRLLTAKTLYKRGYTTDSKKKKLTMLLSQLLPSKPMIAICTNRKGIHSTLVHSFFGGARTMKKNIFPKNLVDGYQTLEFENVFFPVFTGYHDILTIQYGDYMKLPPENERVAALHAQAIDLNRSWSDMEIQTFLDNQ